MLFTSAFNNFAFVSLLTDRDTDYDTCVNSPEEYKKLQKGRHLNFKVFLSWVFMSILQSLIIFVGCIYTFDSKVNIKVTGLIFANMAICQVINTTVLVNKIVNFFRLINLI